MLILKTNFPFKKEPLGVWYDFSIHVRGFYNHTNYDRNHLHGPALRWNNGTVEYTVGNELIDEEDYKNRINANF